MLSYELNTVIKRLAKNITYSVNDIAPSTYKELRSSNNLVIWSGASDKTIFGDPNINYMFRAVHDSMHKYYNLDFSHKSERLLADISANLFARISGDQIARIIHIEIAGQIDYLEQYGEFPANQIEFTLSRLKQA